MALANEKTKDYYNPDFEKLAINLKLVSEAKQDEGFKILLNESIFFRQVMIDFYINILKRVKELKESIETELKVLEDK
jgi:hypothetical protein